MNVSVVPALSTHREKGPFRNFAYGAAESRLGKQRSRGSSTPRSDRRTSGGVAPDARGLAPALVIAHAEEEIALGDTHAPSIVLDPLQLICNPYGIQALPEWIGGWCGHACPKAGSRVEHKPSLLRATLERVRSAARDRVRLEDERLEAVA
eukprot:scaffold86010_cov37-Tisochrysis_lutea.AAC.2